MGERGAGVDGAAVDFESELDAESGDGIKCRLVGLHRLRVEIVVVPRAVIPLRAADADKGRAARLGPLGKELHLLGVVCRGIGGDPGDGQAVVGGDLPHARGVLEEVLRREVVLVLAPLAEALASLLVGNPPDAPLYSIEAEALQQRRLLLQGQLRHHHRGRAVSHGVSPPRCELTPRNADVLLPKRRDTMRLEEIGAGHHGLWMRSWR